MTTQSAKERVYRAAMKLWKQKRPITWTEAQHVANPTVNCLNESLGELARACAAAKKGKKK